jgi:hypothetical protein
MRYLSARLCLLHVLLCVVTTSAGCMDKQATTSSDSGDQPAKLKTTDEIGEFEERDGETVVSSEVTISNPITGPLEAYEPLKQKVSVLAVQHALELFRATNDRYPKDHDEFMTQVIKANSIKLPQLSGGKRYEYDVENHQLVVVRDADPGS